MFLLKMYERCNVHTFFAKTNEKRLSIMRSATFYEAIFLIVGSFQNIAMIKPKIINTVAK